MKREQIDSLLNPDGNKETEFYIDAAIEYIETFTNRSFENGEELDLPTDLVKAVQMLVESADNPTNVSSESVGGEISVSYFSVDVTESIKAYLLPYRKLRW